MPGFGLKGPVLPFLAGAVAALAAAGVAGVLYTLVGGFNVAASIPHTGLVFWTTHTMMAHAVKRRARSIHAPASFSQQQVLAGFQIYEARCAACHGATGLDARWHWADGMTPPPPYLAGAALDWTPPELFWVIKNGVKMTGMPAWGRQCTDAEIWDVVAFLEAMPRMDPGGYRNLRTGQAGRNGAAATPVLAPPAAGCR